MVIEAQGGSGCPSLRLPEQRLNFFPAQVSWICAEMSRETGLELTVLRHLQDLDGLHTCLMEVHSAPERLHGEYVWAKAPTAEWFAAPRENQRLAPWECVGWFDEAVQWTQAQLGAAGYELTGPIQQLKGAWNWSALLTAETGSGKVYFKADYAKPPSEAAVIQELAGQWPQNVPSLIAQDTERGWMLMPDFGGVSLEGRETQDYERAVSKFAEVQRSSALDIERWTTLGCPDRTPSALLRLTRQLLTEGTVLEAGQDSLTEDERGQLERMPEIEELLTRLTASSLPNVISNEDFRDGNVVMRGEPLFYDWSGTVITHPLFGINYFLNRMVRGDTDERFTWRNDLTEARRAITSAFLSEWTEYAPWEQIVSEFWICRRLSHLYEAVRCYADLPFVGTYSPWGIGTLANIPRELRSLAAALGYHPVNSQIERRYE